MSHQHTAADNGFANFLTIWNGAGNALLSLLASFTPFALAAQSLAPNAVPPRAESPPAVRSAVAVRATAPPTLDGKDDDAIWRTAPAITEFEQFAPSSGAAPSFRTTVKIAYDDRYLYVFARCFDPHPDSIHAFLSRRDVATPSDRVKIMIDSYHDRRTGYELAVMPKGVKSDFYTFNGSGGGSLVGRHVGCSHCHRCAGMDGRVPRAVQSDALSGWPGSRVRVQHRPRHRAAERA